MRATAALLDDAFVAGLDLPDAGPALEGGAPIAYSDQRQAVAVGAELAEFTSAVPAGERAAIADCILLAQLAADKAAQKAADGTQDVFGWYDKYVEVLQNIGWQRRLLEFQTQTITDSAVGLHTAIIPIVAAMLGPQAAAASIVLTLLKGLREMDAGTRWITSFDKASQHARGAKFQVSYVDADAQGQPEISLLCVGVDAQRTITQALFFRVSSERADIRQATGKMAVSLERLRAVREAIAGRVQPFMAEYVAKLDI